MSHPHPPSYAATADEEVTPLEAPSAIMILRDVQQNLRDMREEMSEAVGHMLAGDAKVMVLTERVKVIEETIKVQHARRLAFLVALVPVLVGAAISWALGWLRGLGAGK